MKVLITESQLNNAIERLIKRVNKNVVSVNFDVKKQAVMEKGISYYDKTIITVVLDPYNILGGNIHTVKDTGFIKERQEIQKVLNRFMNINTTKYMAPYDIEFYVIGTTRV